ncbi:MAG TPA: CPCC family cysteine-rich protein [Candidatus Baltobacteraceae bacterium]|nr:CPCC family cysteine-rich protein [Candidatus Baltobacteraceae bacterium]
MVKQSVRYTCPCCGYRVFSGPPGTEEVCPICGWCDDLMHLRFPLFNGRPNGISLIDAQANFNVIGAMNEAALKSVRFPTDADERDPDWRPIDLDIDDPPTVPVDFDALQEPSDTTTLYYWSPAYWQSEQ